MRTSIITALIVGLFPAFVLAHVVVKPANVDIGTFQTFTMGVPVEKDVATIGVRLVMPTALQYVSPNVKPGWKIAITKDEAGNVTEISWTGGRIPPGQRDDFLFSARVPAEETKLLWNAYQTYADGSIVAWDAQVATQHNASSSAAQDFSKQGPASLTAVTDPAQDKPTSSRDPFTTVALALSVLALVFSLTAIRRSHTH